MEKRSDVSNSGKYRGLEFSSEDIVSGDSTPHASGNAAHQAGSFL
jgi:hypothetical protein